MGNLFAIGDIHGHFDKLTALIEKIPIDFQRDRLVFLGDYIDRGPHSYEVVEYVIGLKAGHPLTVCLMGNHEEMLLDYLAGVDQMTYLLNGGRHTIDNYLTHADLDGRQIVPPRHLAFFNSLEDYFETEDYIFVHAGLQPKVPLVDQKTRDMRWIRKPFINSRHDFGKQVVFGHTRLSKPLLMRNKIGIDTGVAYGGVLTCVQLPDQIFHSA